MPAEKVNTVVVGGGQAGVAVSGHLSRAGVGHIVLEKNRIAEAWRTARWDSLVANGPAWHDRFPDKTFDDSRLMISDDPQIALSSRRLFEPMNFPKYEHIMGNRTRRKRPLL